MQRVTPPPDEVGINDAVNRPQRRYQCRHDWFRLAGSHRPVGHVSQAVRRKMIDPVEIEREDLFARHPSIWRRIRRKRTLTGASHQIREAEPFRALQDNVARLADHRLPAHF
jgi:hypothetical protein